jgi:hypothetical protein
MTESGNFVISGLGSRDGSIKPPKDLITIKEEEL